jgi:hypothetical protein
VLCDPNTPRKLGITVQEGVQFFFKKKKKEEKSKKNTYFRRGGTEVPAGTLNPY